MRIFKEVYDYILSNVSNVPPEMGGILGERENIICDVQLDAGMNNNKQCSYEPNVIFLNKVISKWEKDNIQFCGIFHTHFHGVASLSNGDIKYIEEIMDAMPDEIKFLYFPVVLPESRKMVIYIAFNSNKKVIIETDNIVIKF